MRCFQTYEQYLINDNGIYGKDCSSVLPEKIFFDEYLVNQAEQLHYLFEMYHTDVENSKEYYDVLVDYIYRDENEYLTFNCNDERLEGSGLASLQYIVACMIVDDFIEYDTDLYVTGVDAEAVNKIRDIVYEHTNQ